MNFLSIVSEKEKKNTFLANKIGQSRISVMNRCEIRLSLIKDNKNIKKSSNIIIILML